MEDREAKAMPAVPAKTNQIDWPGIRAAAVIVGVREAARQAAGNAPAPDRDRFVERVMKRSSREGWITQKTEVMSAPRTNEDKTLSANVRTGADSVAKCLADDRKATRIGFSKAARKVAEDLAKNDVASLTTPAKAIVASKWMGVAAGAQQWEEGKATATMQLQILSVGGAMQVQVGQQDQQ